MAKNKVEIGHDKIEGLFHILYILLVFMQCSLCPLWVGVATETESIETNANCGSLLKT